MFRFTKAWRPLLSLSAFRALSDLFSTSSSLAPGIKAPDVSCTVTVTVPSLPDCARRAPGNSRKSAAREDVKDANRDAENLILRLHKDKQEHRQRIRVGPCNAALPRAYKTVKCKFSLRTLFCIQLCIQCQRNFCRNFFFFCPPGCLHSFRRIQTDVESPYGHPHEIPAF